MTALRIGILGAGGRMGRALIQATFEEPQATLAAAIDRTGGASVGVDAGVLAGVDGQGVSVGDSHATVLNGLHKLVETITPKLKNRSALTIFNYRDLLKPKFSIGLVHKRDGIFELVNDS